MKSIAQAVLDRASVSWREACGHLKVDVIAPYVLQVEKDAVICLAYLPQFGGEKGMVIGAMDLPRLGTDPRLKELAEKKGVFYSFVNAPAFVDAPIEDKAFREALKDWGYFGPKEKRPEWLDK